MAETCAINFTTLVSYSHLIVIWCLSAAVLAVLMGSDGTSLIFANDENEIFRKFELDFTRIVEELFCLNSLVSIQSVQGIRVRKMSK